MPFETENLIGIELPAEYKKFLVEIKTKILSSQLKTVTAVHSELIQLYWEIGNSVLKKQEEAKWGERVTERLAKDLCLMFPHMKGFSCRNVRFMVRFAKEYQDIEIVKQLVSQIPWGHNILIIQRLKTKEERLWYVKKRLKMDGAEVLLAPG